MLSTIFLTLGILIAAAVLESKLSGLDPRAYLAQLRQPFWGPSFAAWLVIGLVYYLTFGSILYRVLGRGNALAVILVVLILLLNAGWNYLFFHRKGLRASFVALFPYGGLIFWLFGLLLTTDPVAAYVMIPYLLYLPFALCWTLTLMRLNSGP